LKILFFAVLNLTTCGTKFVKFILLFQSHGTIFRKLILHIFTRHELPDLFPAVIKSYRFFY